MKVNIEETWRQALQSEFEEPYFAGLVSFLHEEKAKGVRIYPPGPQIFRAFDLCPLPDVKVVILGQDPYHEYGQAMGLSFSVPDGVPAPPSLRNIFKEIESDLGIKMSGRPNLEGWAEQGVLLLNAVLTVRASQAASHSSIGWQRFTDAVIKSKLKAVIGFSYFLCLNNLAYTKINLIKCLKINCFKNWSHRIWIAVLDLLLLYLWLLVKL